MALALYRKYRPRTFAEVIGQEHVTEPLSQALRSGRLHHAYLFSGPRGCGKTSSARILARSLNCEQGPTPDPCGVCASCKSLANDGTGSIDVIEIDAASHGGVDDARDLREKAFFAPASSRYKIYVIDEAHMVSSAGFNALLKLVEEPPDYVKFIFATTEPEKVLGTIRSRTHHYPFRLIPPAVLRPYLQQLTEAEGVHVEPAVFPLVVRAGGGSARDSLSVLDQLIAGAGPEGVSYTRAVSLLGVTDVTLIDEMCDALAAGDGATAYSTIDRVAEAGHDARRFASDLLERFRDLIVLQQVPDAVSKGLIDGPTDQLDAMTAQSTRLGPATLSRCADIVHNGLVEMRGTTAPRLLLELITARMLLPGADDTTGALLQRLERMERRLTLTADHPQDSVRAQQPTPTPTDQGEAPPAAEVTGSGVPSAGAGSRGGQSAARAAAAAASRRAPTGISAAPDVSAGAADSQASSDEAVPEGSVAQSAAVPAERDAGEADVAAEAVVDHETWDGAAQRLDPAAIMADAPEEAGDAGQPGQLTAAAIREVWPEIITTVGRQSKKIAALASGATVRELEGQTVVLTFRFPAHAKMVSDQPQVIVDALYEALGGRWQIRCEVAGEAGGTQRGTPSRPAPTQAAPAQAAPAQAAPAQAAPAQAAPAQAAPAQAAPAQAAPAQAAPAQAGPTQAGPARRGSSPSDSARSGPGQSDQSRPPQSGSTQVGSMQAAPARQREAAAPAATTSDDGDDWPEPARPGGSAAPPTAAQAAGDLGRGEVATDGGVSVGSEPTHPTAGPLPTSAADGLGSAGARSGLAAARAAAAGAGTRSGAAKQAGRPVDEAPSAWSDGSPTDEAPYDPEYDGPARPDGKAPSYEGFDPGDEPLDDVIDEKTARQSSEQQAMQLLQDAFGAEKISET